MLPGMDRRNLRRWWLLGLVAAAVVTGGLWRARGGCGSGQGDSARSGKGRRAAARRARTGAVTRALRARLKARIARARVQVHLLEGRVRSRAGAPIPGAMVRVALDSGALLAARTGPEGRYRLVNPPPRAKRMEVSARGYQTKRFEPMILPPGVRARWDVVLEPAEGLHGVVLVGDRPVPGASVFLISRGRGHPWGRTATGLGGRFSLPWPGGAGPRDLVAVHGQHGWTSEQVDGPGEVILHLPGGGFVEGQVVDDAGRPVRHFGVSSTRLARGAGAPPAQFFDDDGGRFKLGPLASGRQRLFAFGEGYQPATGRAVRIRSGRTVRGVRLVLHASGELLGRITDAKTGQPIPGAVVAPAEWGSRKLGESAGATSDETGSYRLRTVPASRTSLRVVADGYQPLLAGGVECAPGQRVQRDFRLSRVERGERARGQITGVGAVLRRTPHGVQVLRVIDGGPASEGLQRGDVIVMVDDQNVRREGLRKVVQSIRGEAGTDVVLWVERGGGPPVRVVITRDVVSLSGRGGRR